MLVRTYRNRDIAEISRLFYDTIHRVNSRAWAPAVPDKSFWKERFKNYNVYIVEECGQIVGFTELGSTGYIDCFFVHHDRQRCGIGRLLMQKIIATAGRNQISRLHAEVSITALPFFLDQDFVVVRESETTRKDVKLKQFEMERWLARRRR